MVLFNSYFSGAILSTTYSSYVLPTTIAYNIRPVREQTGTGVEHGTLFVPTFLQVIVSSTIDGTI